MGCKIKYSLEEKEMEKGLIFVFILFAIVLSVNPVQAAREVVPLQEICDSTGYSATEIVRMLNLKTAQKEMLLKNKYLISIDVNKIWKSEKSFVDFGKNGFISATICDSSRCTSFFFGNEP